MNANVWLLTLVIALEPIPVLAGVLLLTSQRGRPKAIAFALGWATALIAVALLTALIGSEVSTSSGSTSSKVSALLDIALGAVAVYLAFHTRAQARRDPEAGTPKWMRAIDTMRPISAFALGCLLPPYVIAAAVSNQIIRLNLSSDDLVIALLVFAVVGSAGVLIPILVTVVRPSRSDAVLASWREWLQANWHVLLFWLLFAIGVYLMVKGTIEFFH